MFKRKKGEREVMRKRWKRLAAIVGAAVLVAVSYTHLTLPTIRLAWFSGVDVSFFT